MGRPFIEPGTTIFGFVPFRLEIPDHPEFDVFPLNVLFAKDRAENGRIVWGTALYEPDFTSYHEEDGKFVMRYDNAYGGNHWLVIGFEPAKGSYTGEKFVSGKFVGAAGGTEWNMFFAHLTRLRLSQGERCRFTDEEELMKR